MRNSKQENDLQSETLKLSEAKKNIQKDKETMAYLGPSFQGLIQKGVVLEQGLSPKMKGLIENNPFIQGLFVPIHQLAERRKELKIKGSELYLLYQKAEKLKEGNYV